MNNKVSSSTGNEILAQFTTNGFVGNPLSTILLATISGMSFMFLTISYNASMFVSMGGLFAGILLVYGLKVGSIRYTLTHSGINQRIRRFLPYKLSKKEQDRFIPWSDIKSFKNDTDRNRSGAEYEFLKLYLRKSPREIWITDERDGDGFRAFKDAFLHQIYTEESHSNVRTRSKKPTTAHIVQKKSFYATWFAKVLTVFFAVLVIGIFYYSETHGWKYSHQIKFQAILLPGTVYMIYRVFVKKND